MISIIYIYIYDIYILYTIYFMDHIYIYIYIFNLVGEIARISGQQMGSSVIVVFLALQQLSKVLLPSGSLQTSVLLQLPRRIRIKKLIMLVVLQYLRVRLPQTSLLLKKQTPSIPLPSKAQQWKRHGCKMSPLQCNVHHHQRLFLWLKSWKCPAILGQ